MYRHLRPTAAAGRPDAVAVAAFADHKRPPAGYQTLDEQTGGALAKALARAEFSAEPGQITCLYPAKGVPRLMVMGLGRRDRFDAAALRLTASRLLPAASAAGVRRLDLRLKAGLDGAIDDDAAGRAAGEGLAIANFQFDAFKGAVAESEQKGRPKGLSATISIDAPMRPALARALTVGESVNVTRTLAATPPNVANPAYVAAYCRKMARQVGLRCTVIDARRMAQLKMGGLLAVGGAGSTPPALVCLEWPGTAQRGRSASGARSAGRPRTDAPVMLVGKSITFDTGGYSIKPADSMLPMKYDKCGGMAVIGAMHAIARLKLPLPVVGLVTAAENMIDQTAYRPSDIITLCNGVSVEVTNTDAEGRLVLADALAYGCKHYKPAAVIDLATLTGGCVVALGTYCAGAFVNDADLRAHLFDAGQDTGERLWHLPLWEEHRKAIRGTHGDIVNSAGREASPCQGAAFLSYFVARNGDFTAAMTGKAKDLPWAHLDIAGVADTKGEGATLHTKGPTGFGVRLLVRALETWKKH